MALLGCPRFGAIGVPVHVKESRRNFPGDKDSEHRHSSPRSLWIPNVIVQNRARELPATADYDMLFGIFSECPSGPPLAPPVFFF
jgi:hypothetical protein